MYSDFAAAHEKLLKSILICQKIAWNNNSLVFVEAEAEYIRVSSWTDVDLKYVCDTYKSQVCDFFLSSFRNLLKLFNFLIKYDTTRLSTFQSYA